MLPWYGMYPHVSSGRRMLVRKPNKNTLPEDWVEIAADPLPADAVLRFGTSRYRHTSTDWSE